MRVFELAQKTWLLNRRAFKATMERRESLAASADYWRRMPDLVYREHEPVFVLSTGRCGTELLTRLFELSPGIACYHAPQPELVGWERQAYERGNREFEAFKLLIDGCRFELIVDCIRRRRRYVETNCRVTFFAQHLYELYPRSRFIHLVRHPGDFIRSGVMRRYYEGKYSDLGRITPTTSAVAAEWPVMSVYQRCAWLWNETNRFIEGFKEGRDENRIITIKAENLFQATDATHRIFEFCGLKPLPERLVKKMIRRPVNANRHQSAVPHFSAWSDEMKNEVRPWIQLSATYDYRM